MLVWSQRFDVLDLVEDELIMALPMVPLHDSCPSLPASMAVPDIADSEKRPNPFAVLSQLREPKS